MQTCIVFLLFCGRQAIKLSYRVHRGNLHPEQPVVILHGLLGTGKNFDALAKQLVRTTGRTVGTCCKKSFEMITNLLGILIWSLVISTYSISQYYNILLCCGLDLVMVSTCTNFFFKKWLIQTVSGLPFVCKCSRMSKIWCCVFFHHNFLHRLWHVMLVTMAIVIIQMRWASVLWLQIYLICYRRSKLNPAFLLVTVWVEGQPWH